MTWNDQILSLLRNGNGEAINSTISVRTWVWSLLFSSKLNSLLFSNWTPWNKRKKKWKDGKFIFQRLFHGCRRCWTRSVIINLLIPELLINTCANLYPFNAWNVISSRQLKPLTCAAEEISWIIPKLAWFSQTGQRNMQKTSVHTTRKLNSNDREFIWHRRSENSLFTMKNYPADVR